MEFRSSVAGGLDALPGGAVSHVTGYHLGMNTKIVRALVALACASVLAAACSGGGSSSSKPGQTPSGDASKPRPTAVPQAASLISADVTFGSPDANSNPADSELFFATSCQNDVLAVVTNRRAVYAELPCDRALPASQSERFLGKPVRVRVVVASVPKIFLESTAAGSVEFTVGRVWQMAN
jgi:hypothetical protein